MTAISITRSPRWNHVEVNSASAAIPVSVWPLCACQQVNGACSSGEVITCAKMYCSEQVNITKCGRLWSGAGR